MDEKFDDGCLLRQFSHQMETDANLGRSPAGAVDPVFWDKKGALQEMCLELTRYPSSPLLPYQRRQAGQPASF
jgi:hypothetical protein